MNLDIENRQARLSVGEYARLGQRPCSLSGNSPHRAAIGVAWHNQMQEQAEARFENASFEIPIQGALTCGNWTIFLQGRIDQLIRHADGSLGIREIKSTALPLPANPQELTERYPHYLHQLDAYAELIRIQFPDTTIQPELVFVCIADGITQSLQLEVQSSRQRLREHGYTAASFFESRRLRRARLSTFELPNAFERPREGQVEASQKLIQALEHKQHTLFQAPTGFGKTRLALHAALSELRAGHCQRILFITGKTTNQFQTTDQLRAWQHGTHGLRVVNLRNQQAHELDEAPLRETDPLELSRRWHESALEPEALFQDGTFTLEHARALGQQHRIPPYLITLACLPHADIWIADYNYIFAPQVRHLLEYLEDYSPSDSLLIVDEAHHLPERVADAHSTRMDAATLWLLVDELEHSGTDPGSTRAARELAEFFESLKRKEKLDTNIEYELAALLEVFEDTLERRPPSYEDLPDFASECLQTLRLMQRLMQEETLEWMLHAPQPGSVEVRCLDASAVISETLNDFHRTLMMSATLFPHERYCAECGLALDTVTQVEASAHWHNEALHLAIDIRADTRFKARQQSYGLTAQTIQSMLAHFSAPLVVFFSSYRYAETVAAYLQADDPLCRIAVQERQANPESNREFIELALKQQDVLFLILGSSFSESVDILGGRVHAAMVVGPALPEVNVVQEARLRALEHLGRERAFEAVYIIPGMRKVLQAIGRLIREPGQRAHILLHDKRFANPAYSRHLPEADAPHIRNESSLLAWMGDNHEFDQPS